MIVNAAVLVIRDQQQGALPKVRVPSNRVVDLCDKRFASEDVMVGVLVRGENLATIAFVVAVVWLDEAVLGESILFAVRKEVLEQSKQFRLILEKIDHFQRRALRIKIVELRRVARLHHALID